MYIIRVLYVYYNVYYMCILRVLYVYYINVFTHFYSVTYGVPGWVISVCWMVCLDISDACLCSLIIHHSHLGKALCRRTFQCATGRLITSLLWFETFSYDTHIWLCCMCCWLLNMLFMLVIVWGALKYCQILKFLKAHKSKYFWGYIKMTTES